MLKLDIRTKIFILVVANILMFKMMTVNIHLLVALCFSIYLGISSNIKRMSRFFGIYLFFTVYEVFFAHAVTLHVIDSFLLLTGIMFKTLYFPLCAGMALVSSSKVSELICFLRSIRLPKKMIIVLAVLYRFFPVLLTDYRLIKNSLKMKGIGVSRGFFEYIFVPYVIISTNIANELSVSCLCRGIDNEEKPSSYIELKFNKIDYIVMTIVVIACCCIMFLRW